MDWESLQVLIKGLYLNDLMNHDFIRDLEEKLENKCVEVINIQIRVRDEKIHDDSDYEIVSLANRDFKDTLLNQAILDADSHEILNTFIESINKLEE